MVDPQIGDLLVYTNDTFDTMEIGIIIDILKKDTYFPYVVSWAQNKDYPPACYSKEFIDKWIVRHE